MRDILTTLARNVVSVLLLRESERIQRERAFHEATLRESQAKFRLIAEAVPQMVWSTSAEGRPDYFNQRWYDFTGMPIGRAGEDAYRSLLHPQDREAAWAGWQHSLATEQPYETE